MNNTSIIERKRFSVKAQTLAALIALVVAVALPQVFHLMGAMSGLGASLGEAFLPMHLPILTVGLVAGPWAGLSAGALAPLVSAMLTGMPKEAMLPFMMIELAVYGLVSGLLASRRLPTVAKVLFAQAAGRAVRAAAILVSVYVFGKTAVPVSVIWTSITAGIFGLALQWVLLPLAMYRVEHHGK